MPESSPTRTLRAFVVVLELCPCGAVGGSVERISEPRISSGCLTCFSSLAILKSWGVGLHPDIPGNRDTLFFPAAHPPELSPELHREVLL